MTKTEMKKKQLIDWIRYKMERAGESFTDTCKTIEKCRKMSYKALHSWAINNDFIDY